MFKKKALIPLIIVLVLSITALQITGFTKAAAREKIELKILTTPMGGSVYEVSFGLADLLNKHHPWIRASAIETKGDIENISYIVNNPDSRKNTIIFSTAQIIAATMKGKALCPKYTNLRAITRFSLPGDWSFITFNKNLKKPEDLVGKKIALDLKGQPTAWYGEAILKQWGIFNKVKIHHLSYAQQKDALINGVVDAAYIIDGLYLNPNKVIPNPITAEIMATRPVYIFDISEETARAVAEDLGVGMFWHKIMPNSWKPGVPDRPVGQDFTLLMWWADISMDEEIVYELTKFIIEHAKEFKNYHASATGLSIKFITDNSPLTEEIFHPGTLKYLNEIGKKIGEQ